MCLALGYEHPDVLLDVLSAKQIQEWEAFDRVQPIGGKRLDFYFAFLMTSIHNLAISVHGKKGAKQFEFEDFIPNWVGTKEEPKVMSSGEMKQWWKGFAKKHNERVRERQKQNLKPKKEK